VLDNLTTVLVLGAVVVALGRDSPRFVALACINLVVATNTGGVCSPFGDVTTLMVWQQRIVTPQGAVEIGAFLRLLPAALVSFLVPAVALSRALPQGCLLPDGPAPRPRRGAWAMLLLFLATIATAVVFQGVLHLPGVMGMLTGLSYLQLLGYYLKRTHPQEGGALEGPEPYDIFERVAGVEWDTLLFLYGVTLCVGGLSHLGYLALVSDAFYGQLGHTTANLGAGLLSGLLESAAAMAMVLHMHPQMGLDQWLLATYATGSGGALLAIGSAAGVALIGQTRGRYTFLAHLRWTPVILMGYLAGAAVFLLLAQSRA
jgi:Na+/H+ antiporter NhaD/arsenite permease-like protein